MFERETRREKILEGRNRELKLKEKERIKSGLEVFFFCSNSFKEENKVVLDYFKVKRTKTRRGRKWLERNGPD
jgi:hypothetical protein